MKQLRIVLVGFVAIIGLAFLPLAPASAINVFQSGCNSGGGGGGGGATGGTGGGGSGSSSICGATQTDTVPNIVKNVINLMLLVLGMIAVIMIVIGGIRYTTSNGDQNAMTSAKNTILYSVIGLVIAIFAFPIVNFVIDAFSGGGGGGANNTGGTGQTISPTQNPASGTVTNTLPGG